jgi:DNA topoisomerase-1
MLLTRFNKVKINIKNVELDKKKFSDSDTVENKVAYYNEANKEVAVLCNHQKSVPKTFDTKSEAMQQILKDHIQYLMDLNEHYQSFDKKSKKKEKIEKKKKEEDEDASSKKLKRIFPDDKEKTKKQINVIQAKITKMEGDMKKREDMKQIALGTSKLNYMDPRITVAWCKTNDVPIDKVFTKSIRDKFPWAMYAEPSYQF